ncbi:unnamed protein product [Ectocarpus fasciculatus]
MGREIEKVFNVKTTTNSRRFGGSWIYRQHHTHNSWFIYDGVQRFPGDMYLNLQPLKNSCHADKINHVPLSRNTSFGSTAVLSTKTNGIETGVVYIDDVEM